MIFIEWLTVITNSMSRSSRISSERNKLRSHSYVFVSLQDEEEPQDTKFQIDGAYIPRIFMLGTKC